MASLRILWAVVLVLLWVHPVAAQTSQPWVQDRRFNQGPGIRSGSVEFHPSLSGELGYDSNFYQGSGIEEEWNVYEPVVPTLRLRLTPALVFGSTSEFRRGGRVQALVKPKATFSARVAGRFDKLYSLNEYYKDAVASQNLIGGEAALVSNINPGRPFGARVGLDASRIAQPNNDPGLVDGAFNRTTAGGNLDLLWRPGGGVLEWGLGYGAKVILYDETAFGLDRVQHGLRTRGRWRFLPRTSLLYEANWGLVTHSQASTRQLDANPMSTTLGINGLITERLALLLQGGWKAIYYDEDTRVEGDDFDSAVGRLELTWFLAAPPERLGDGKYYIGLSTIRFGLERDARNSGISNFYEINRAYGELAYFSGGKSTMGLNAGFAMVTHGPPLDASGTVLTDDGDSIVEWRPDARLFGEYRVTSSLAVFLNAGFSASPANNRVMVDRSLLRRDNLRYLRFTTFLGVRWFN